jgi:hypothetical protein
MLVVPETVAVNCCVRPICKLALGGEIETEIVPGGDVTKTVALA